MSYDALETVKLRNEFYRDGYRKVLTALLICLFIILALSISVIYLLTHQPAPKYFAATEEGRIIPLIPLNEPNLTEQTIRQWAATATTALYSYNFVNFRQVLSDDQKYFTSAGWRDFLKQLSASQNLQAVQTRQLVVSAIPTGVPVITNQGVLNGRYFWRVQIPILVSYQSQSDNLTDNLLVTLTIRRVSTLIQNQGIGIESFVAEQSS